MTSDDHRTSTTAPCPTGWAVVGLYLVVAASCAVLAVGSAVAAPGTPLPWILGAVGAVSALVGVATHLRLSGRTGHRSTADPST